MQVSYVYVITHPWNRLRDEVRAAENRLMFDFGQQKRAVMSPRAARVRAHADMNRQACASAGSSLPQLSGRQYRGLTRLSSEMLFSYDKFDRPNPVLPPSRRAPNPSEPQRKQHRTQRRSPACSHQRPFTSPAAADDASRLPELRHMGPWPRKPAFSSSKYSSLGRLAAARSASGTRAAQYLHDAMECR